MENCDEENLLVEAVQMMNDKASQEDKLGQLLSDKEKDNSEDDGFDEEDMDFFGLDDDDFDFQLSPSPNLPSTSNATATAGNMVPEMSGSGSIPKKIKVCMKDELDDGDGCFYHVLSTTEITQCMATSITEVNAILQLPSTTVRLLLNHFGWSEEKLVEAYYETGDTQQLFKDAMIFHEDVSDKVSPKSYDISGTGVEDEEDCEICYLPRSTSALFGMKCGHRFCTDCWVEYISGRILEGGCGGTLQVILCAAHNCPIFMDDDTVMSLLKDTKMRVKYQQLITNKFVQCNRLMKWCPGPECTFAIKVLWLDGKGLGQVVSCSGCSTKFCFECQTLNGHTPVKCEMMQKWLKKCEDDSETANWLVTNTKHCPKCKWPIEKDGGCNLMYCTACQVRFCWVCLRKWSYHGGRGYGCNRYEEKWGKLETRRDQPERYLFYCKHFNNQRNSLKLEGLLEEKMGRKIEEFIGKLEMSWVEAGILKQAVEILSECRQTLMNTYVFAYYVEKSNDEEIFEDNQQDLANATEKLSGCLERDIDGEGVKWTDIKQRVLDMSKYCAGRRKVLIDHVEEGREKDSWVYIK